MASETAVSRRRGDSVAPRPNARTRPATRLSHAAPPSHAKPLAVRAGLRAGPKPLAVRAGPAQRFTLSYLPIVSRPCIPATRSRMPRTLVSKPRRAIAPAPFPGCIGASSAAVSSGWSGSPDDTANIRRFTSLSASNIPHHPSAESFPPSRSKLPIPACAPSLAAQTPSPASIYPYLHLSIC
jgi:hypothetical protein